MKARDGGCEGIGQCAVAGLDALCAGRSPIDMSHARAKMKADLGRDIAGDFNWHGIPRSWYEAIEVVMPVPKELLSLRLDTDVVDWSRQQESGYQTRFNAMLRGFVAQQSRGRLG